MAVGKGSIKRAAKAVESAAAKEVVEAIVEKPAEEKKPAAKKTTTRKAPAKKAPKKEEVKEVKTVGIGTDLPVHLL